MPDEWIRQWSDPALHMRARPVAQVDAALRAQVARMADRLVEAEGAGLAAPQVGILRRVFVYRFEPGGPVEVLVDPEVVAASAEEATFVEGCLSFQAVTVAVRRPVAVRVEGRDLDGRTRSVEAEGPGASLLQHELDHLDGVLTLNRATAAERRRAVVLLSYGAAELAA